MGRMSHVKLDVFRGKVEWIERSEGLENADSKFLLVLFGDDEWFFFP